jgi:hypothetical protein
VRIFKRYGGIYKNGQTSEGLLKFPLFFFFLVCGKSCCTPLYRLYKKGHGKVRVLKVGA